MLAFVISAMLAASAPSRASEMRLAPGQPLPTGQRLTPLAAPGARFTLLRAEVGPSPGYVADGAAAAVTSPDGRELLVLTSGFNRFNGSDGKVVPGQSQQYVFRYALGRQGARRVQSLTVPNSFGGIAWAPDGRSFLVGGGVDDVVHRFRRGPDGFAELDAPIALGHAAGLGADVKPQAAGVAFSPDGRRALVANYYNDSVSLIDLALGRVIGERDLRPGRSDPARVGVAGGEFPFAIVWTDADRAFVSAPRDRQVVELSIGPTDLRVTRRIATAGEPTALLADRAAGRLYATEDNADRVAMIDLASARLVAEPRIGLPAAQHEPLPKGLNPNGLARLPGGRLLVTLGGVNAVAVAAPLHDGLDVLGLVPTGWYPSAVAASRDGRQVFVVNRKSPPGSNPNGCAPKLAIYRGQPDACGAANQYIFQLEKAGLLQFPLPDARALGATTLQVAANIGLSAARERALAEAAMASVRARVKHVIFIIKENRTYDQVLGDLDRGNGDPSLALLGAKLSPNHHAIARQFVTLDAFYDSGEQSSTGWTWSTAGRAPDLLEKTAPVNYAKRGLAYEAEEADRFIYTAQTPAERRATNPKLSDDPDLLPGAALLTAPDGDDDAERNEGFLWNAALRAGLSVRNYGFSDASIYDAGAPGAVPLVREPAKTGVRIYTPGDRLLASRSDPFFRGFDQKMPDYWRALEWRREFTAQDAADRLPTLTLLRLSHDHFGDFKEAIDGVDTVETEMADNDYALGLVLESVANSRARDTTLVAVIEDDAQNGADHVDARRSVALLAGAMVRRDALVSTRYTTVNLLRTLEAVLGLKPLGLNDAMAVPMADAFLPAPRAWSYRAAAAAVLRTTQLPIPADRYAVAAPALGACGARTAGYWSKAMVGQDFRTEDRLNTVAFNAALWRGLGRGPEPAVRSAADLRSHRLQRLASPTRADCAG